jgi:hypothetical protein
MDFLGISALVFPPHFFGAKNVRVLRTLAPSAQQQRILTVVSTIDSIARSNVIQDQFQNSLANVVMLPPQSSSQFVDSCFYLALAARIFETSEPFVEWN